MKVETKKPWSVIEETLFRRYFFDGYAGIYTGALAFAVVVLVLFLSIAFH